MENGWKMGDVRVRHPGILGILGIMESLKKPMFFSPEVSESPRFQDVNHDGCIGELVFWYVVNVNAVSLIDITILLRRMWYGFVQNNTSAGLRRTVPQLL